MKEADLVEAFLLSLYRSNTMRVESLDMWSSGFDIHFNLTTSSPTLSLSFHIAHRKLLFWRDGLPKDEHHLLYKIREATGFNTDYDRGLFRRRALHWFTKGKVWVTQTYTTYSLVPKESR